VPFFGGGQLIRRLCTLIAVAATAALAFTASASATTTPTRMDASEQGWNHMVQRPGRIIVGQGGAPVTYDLRWSRWASSSGKAYGKLILWWCYPTSSCPGTKYNVTVWVDDTKTHDGQPYFSHMIYQYVNRKGDTKRITMNYLVDPGASVPGWH
jgi:hypothetical protein